MAVWTRFPLIVKILIISIILTCKRSVVQKWTSDDFSFAFSPNLVILTLFKFFTLLKLVRNLSVSCQEIDCAPNDYCEYKSAYIGQSCLWFTNLMLEIIVIISISRLPRDPCCYPNYQLQGPQISIQISARFWKSGRKK